MTNPERVVLITRKDPQLLAQAWEAGIVSVVSAEDPINTVLLAIMAAALRVAKSHGAAATGAISPSPSVGICANSPTQTGHPGPNVAKLNSLEASTTWPRACNTSELDRKGIFSRVLLWPYNR